MNVYPFIKALHVISVVIWVGGDFTLLVLSLHRRRAGDDAAFVRFLPDVMFATTHVAIPASLVALVCGLTMVFMTWDFGQLWILIGLAGFATVFVSGTFFLRPRTERLMAGGVEASPAELVAHAGGLLRLVGFDHVVMFLVVVDMVVKPGFADSGIWLAMLVVLVVSATLLWLVPARRHQ